MVGTGSDRTKPEQEVTQMAKKKMIVLDKGVELKEVAASMACCKTSGQARFKTD